MKVYKLSELPEFKGKALALESQRLGLQSLPLGEMDATLAMLIGLMQVVEGLQTEVQDLQDRLKKPEAESKFQASVDIQVLMEKHSARIKVSP